MTEVGEYASIDPDKYVRMAIKTAGGRPDFLVRLRDSKRKEAHELRQAAAKCEKIADKLGDEINRQEVEHDRLSEDEGQRDDGGRSG